MEKSYHVLRTYSFTHQADLDMNLLQSQGIDAYLSDTNMGSFSYMGVGGGVKIHVEEDDLERANDLLQESNSQSVDD